MPPGIHPATWAEFTERYALNAHRSKLLDGLKKAAIVLRRANCPTLYMGGSFVTAKEFPNDFDGCWDLTGVNAMVLEEEAPALLRTDRKRVLQKALYGGELLMDSPFVIDRPFRDFFQEDKQGRRKGIVAIDLRTIEDDQK